MSSSRFDVIVVGAGPAGLHAAIAAAGRGASVLVFEKKTTIGVPVRCGEFFPCKEEMLDLLPSCKEFAHLFEIPSHSVRNTCDTIRIYSPIGKCWEFPFRAYVVDRVSLEQDLFEEARKLGAQFRLGRAARIFDKNGQVKVGPNEAESVETSVVIAADGFPSIAASSGGLVDSRYAFRENAATNYQYLMEDLNIESHVTEMYMGTSIAPGGYGWIIPKSRDTANVGVGVRTTFMRVGKARDYLDYFVNRHALTSGKLRSGTVRTIITDLLPIDGAVSKTYSNGLLSVGDSAAMVMPTNGGGIPTAMVSGQIAGEVAALHVQRGEPLCSYEARWQKAIGRELTASTRMRRFADSFMRHDRLLDCAMRILRTSGIKKVVTCKVPSGLDFAMKLLGY